jgi:hypothetical protein
MARPQANIALESSEYDVLQAIAFVEERSVSEVLRPLVSDYVAARGREPEVKKALDALLGGRERRSKTV